MIYSGKRIQIHLPVALAMLSLVSVIFISRRIFFSHAEYIFFISRRIRRIMGFFSLRILRILRETDSFSSSLAEYTELWEFLSLRILRILRETGIRILREIEAWFCVKISNVFYLVTCALAVAELVNSFKKKCCVSW